MRAAAPRSSTPGRRSRSTRTWRRSPGAREIRVPLAEGYVHDLDAMLAEITAATQLVLVCNPNNPTGTHIPAARIGAFFERVPDHVTVVLDEAYVEFQTDDDPDATRRPAAPTSRTWSSCARSARCYGLAGLRVGYALCSAKFRAAVDAVRQPFSVNALAQAAAAEAILHQDDVAERVERTVVERLFVEEELRELGLETAGHAGQLLLGRARRPRRGRGGRGARPTPGSSSAAASRSAAPATSASPTAPAPRTSASSAALRGRDSDVRSANCGDLLAAAIRATNLGQ